MDGRCPPEERRDCAQRVSLFGERIRALEVSLGALHRDYEEQHRDFDALTQEVKTMNGFLADLVRRPEFVEALAQVHGRFSSFVPKARYQLIEAAVIAFISCVTLGVTGFVGYAVAKFLGWS